MSKHMVRCRTRCWDSSRTRMYNMGQGPVEIESLEPIAMYFDGWPDGTEVYHKIKGTRTSPNIETTRIVGGAKPVQDEEAAPAEILTCEVCGEYTTTNPQALVAHRRHCLNKKKRAAELKAQQS